MNFYKWICLLMLSATLAWVAAAAPARTDDGIEVRRLGIPATDTGTDRALRLSETAFNTAALDEVWLAAGDQDWLAARKKLNRLKQRTSDWAPPAELTRLIEQGLKDQAFAAAIEDENWRDALRLGSDRDASCPGTAWFWGLTQAYAETNQSDTLGAYLTQALGTCRSAADQARIIDRAIEKLPLDLLQAFQDRNSDSLTQADRERLTSHINDGLRAAMMQAAWDLLPIDPAAAQLEFERALTLAFDTEAEYGVAIAAYQDGDHRPALALSLDGDDTGFRSERSELKAFAHLREADMLINASEFDRAEDLIGSARRLSVKTHQNATSLSASISLARADKAYRAQDFDAAIQFARAAETVKVTRDAAQNRIAWALYQRGDDRAAYEAFAALYQTTSSEESANGLVLAASRAGWLDRLQPIATTRSGPLLDRLKSETARTALGRKDYLLAQRSAPSTLSELVGVDRPYIRQSIASRANDGVAGEGRVSSVASRSSVGFTSGQTHIEIGAVMVDMESGRGDDPARSSEAQSTMPFLKVEREGAISVAAQISTTPLSGPVASALTGELAVSRETNNRVRAEAAIFHRAVDESLTSAFGREHAVTGETWGRVLESGLEASASMPINERTNVQASARVSALDGKTIKTNQATKIDLALVRSFAAKHHDYLSAGPFYQFQAFDKNTNFHSPEHGGYFSPQAYHRAGLGIYGQTEDLKSWMLRYQASGAVEHSETDAAAIRPVTAPGGGMFEGGSDTNLAGAARIELARKLNPEWTLTAGASAIASTAFNEVQAGVSLKFVPGGKARITTRDLAPDLFSRDIL
jgi:hypothetical protein